MPTYGRTGGEAMASAELLLHPVRLRIVQAFLGDRRLTTAQLREELPDVPTATLYRQVATLVEGNVLVVASEHKVRGASERTFALAGTTVVGAEEARELTVEEHRQAFLAFVAMLLADYDRYLERGTAEGGVDLGRDLVGYRQLALHLTDEELLALIADLGDVLRPRLAHEPTPERTRRLFSTILMPSR